MMVLLGGVGLALDASVGYYYNAEASTAASAAALSGVIFMPYQFASIPSKADATDRAIAEAARNGYDASKDATVTVTPAVVAGQSEQLKVTVSKQAPLFFMGIFGIPKYNVSRFAIASYTAPVQLGQPGSQMGSTVSKLGTVGNYYFMHDEAWSEDRQYGDPYTPDPSSEYGGALSPPSKDVHQLSSNLGTDTADATLPARGGYNYSITIPAGTTGTVQVYNAVFGPEAVHNQCENNRLGSNVAAIGPCGLAGANYYYWEDLFYDFSTIDLMSAMEYTLFKVNNNYIHNSDTKIAQFKVLPIDATNWSTSKYTDVNRNKTITQTYNANGTPSNMLTYHNWVDVMNYSGASDGSPTIFTRTGGLSSGLLAAGTYRLRVDALNYDGTSPATSGWAFKAYAVRVLDSSGAACATCSLSALGDMQMFTPFTTVAGGSFPIPLFALPVEYAGHTITVDIFDPGDIAGAGNVDLAILDPSGAVATPTPPAKVNITDLGVSRTSIGVAPVLIGNTATATFQATTGGTTTYNGHWVELQIPIPTTYSPGANKTWQLRYTTSSGVTANDVLTFVVGRGSSPPHLLP
jgi:hypothetical protein